jgi:hypothetical protein
MLCYVYPYFPVDPRARVHEPRIASLLRHKYRNLVHAFAEIPQPHSDSDSDLSTLTYLRPGSSGAPVCVCRRLQCVVDGVSCVLLGLGAASSTFDLPQYKY